MGSTPLSLVSSTQSLQTSGGQSLLSIVLAAGLELFSLLHKQPIAFVGSKATKITPTQFKLFKLVQKISGRLCLSIQKWGKPSIWQLLHFTTRLSCSEEELTNRVTHWSSMKKGSSKQISHNVHWVQRECALEHSPCSTGKYTWLAKRMDYKHLTGRYGSKLEWSSF